MVHEQQHKSVAIARRRQCPSWKMPNTLYSKSSIEVVQEKRWRQFLLSSGSKSPAETNNSAH